MKSVMTNADVNIANKKVVDNNIDWNSKMLLTVSIVIFECRMEKLWKPICVFESPNYIAQFEIIVS